MSESSKKGAKLERDVAKILRSKLHVNVRRDTRSGAGATTKTDIKDWGSAVPLGLECKDQRTVKIKDWFKQADATSSYHQPPTVVFRSDEDILATLRFTDLVNFLAEIQQLRAELDTLKQPVMTGGEAPPAPTSFYMPEFQTATQRAVEVESVPAAMGMLSTRTPSA